MRIKENETYTYVCMYVCIMLAVSVRRSAIAADFNEDVPRWDSTVLVI
jgi:hypothetical protein